MATSDDVTAAAVDAFLEANLQPADREHWSPEIAASVAAFAERHACANRRVLLVTSGGTSVPLERNPVRFVANFSTGGRGARLTERLLRRPETAVVFLSKRGSQRPFHRALAAASDPLSLLDDPRVREAAAASAASSDRLITVAFDTVVQYLLCLRGAAQAVESAFAVARESYDGASAKETPERVAPPPPIVVLAAAVSDYFVPLSAMPEHKMSGAGADGRISLEFSQVPKCLGVLRREWAPSLRVVSFKLETDEQQLELKAKGNLDAYACDAVVANLLQSYTHHATVYFGPGVAARGASPSVVITAADKDGELGDAGLEERICETVLPWL